MSEPLKPCPFCGTDNPTIFSSGDVACRSEDCTVESHITEWNHRPIETELRERIRVLEAELKAAEETNLGALNANLAKAYRGLQESFGKQAERIRVLEEVLAAASRVVELAKFWKSGPPDAGFVQLDELKAAIEKARNP